MVRRLHQRHPGGRSPRAAIDDHRGHAGDTADTHAVSVTVTATDRVTGAPVRGNVIVGGVAITRTPFTLTIPANRQLVDGEWEWVPVVPAASVEAPGYNPGAVAFEVIP